MSKAVIYNQFSYNALLAAAIIKTELEDVSVYDLSTIVEPKHDTYIWVGVEKPLLNWGTDATHVILIDNTLISSHFKKTRFEAFIEKLVFTKANPNETIIPDIVETDGLEFRKLTLIDKVCNTFGIPIKKYQKLSHLAEMFHNKDADIKTLSFVYSSLLNAQETVIHNKPFTVPEFDSPSNEDLYLSASREVKGYLNKRYNIIKTRNHFKYETFIYTTCSEFNWHLALRLIKLSHKNFVNASIGANGSLVYGNVNEAYDFNLGSASMVMSH